LAALPRPLDFDRGWIGVETDNLSLDAARTAEMERDGQTQSRDWETKREK
jgi:hypothetical protein